MRKLLFSGDSSKGSLVILVTKLFRFVSNCSVHVCKHWLDFVILSSFFFSVFIDMEVSCLSPSESICFLINFIAFRQKFPQSLEQNRILKNLLCKQFLPFTRVSCRKVPLCLTWLPAIFEKNFNQAIRKLFNWYSYPKRWTYLLQQAMD